MRKDGFFQRALFWLAGFLAPKIVGAYYLTVRVRNAPDAQRYLHTGAPGGVYAFWHSHQLTAVWHLRHRGAAILISASRDGEYIARVAGALGFVPLRGSSSRRGAAALMEMIRHVSAGGIGAVTPDGPRGPRYSVHPGVLAIARKTDRPIYPFAFGLSHYWEAPSWDRFRIPKPFSRAYFLVGEPFHVPAETDDERLVALADKLRARLLALEAEADRAAREGR